ncbi:hypothetical protein A3F66_00405 [candidate division TM6 bacterium RIFCSPHIGHO2_12_FULL_32_22]|nr:MAG: hypothetical protein A3F66_00405 [candidate division TM6 bacterium RIFCSPHIGHO2_12_FULL_32_22]
MKFKFSLIFVFSSFATMTCCSEFPAGWEAVDCRSALKASVNLSALSEAELLERLDMAIAADNVQLVAAILPEITAAPGIGGSTRLRDIFIDLKNKTQNQEIQDLLLLEADINNAEWLLVGEVPIPDLPQTPVRNANDFSWMFEAQVPERQLSVSLSDLIVKLSKLELELGERNLHRLDQAIGWFVRAGGQLPKYIRDRISKARSRATSQGAGGAAGPA